MIRWSYSFVCTSHYRIIIIMRTYLKVLNFKNDCQVHSVSSVCLRLSQFSQLSFTQYMGLCVFSLPIPIMLIVRMHVVYLIIIIKSEVWPICHCWWLGDRTTVCVVWLFKFLLVIRWCTDTNTTMRSWTGMRRIRFNTKSPKLSHSNTCVSHFPVDADNAICSGVTGCQCDVYQWIMSLAKRVCNLCKSKKRPLAL